MSEQLATISCCVPLADPALSDDDAEATAELFRALGDPARVKIVNALARGGEPVCACEFEPTLGLAQPTVSHHLRRLTDAGLLEREQRGRWAYYSLSGEALQRLSAIVEFAEVKT